MDDLPPRMAFGHLDQDLEDVLIFDVLLAVIHGERRPVQDTKILTADSVSLRHAGGSDGGSRGGAFDATALERHLTVRGAGG